MHLLRDAEREPSLIEGWAVAVREDGRPLMSAKDEVRLKWQNQKPGPDTYRCYLELRPRTGELLLTRPVSGGGMDDYMVKVWALTGECVTTLEGRGKAITGLVAGPGFVASLGVTDLTTWQPLGGSTADAGSSSTAVATNEDGEQQQVKKKQRRIVASE